MKKSPADVRLVAYQPEGWQRRRRSELVCVSVRAGADGCAQEREETAIIVRDVGLTRHPTPSYASSFKRRCSRCQVR